MEAAVQLPVPARRGPSNPRDIVPVPNGVRRSRDPDAAAAEEGEEEEAASFDLE
jgi:hypothetical protein